MWVECSKVASEPVLSYYSTGVYFLLHRCEVLFRPVRGVNSNGVNFSLHQSEVTFGKVHSPFLLRCPQSLAGLKLTFVFKDVPEDKYKNDQAYGHDHQNRGGNKIYCMHGLKSDSCLQFNIIHGITFNCFTTRPYCLTIFILCSRPSCP